MTTKGPIPHVLRGGAVLAMALLVACATPATHPATEPAPAAAPTPCADPSYIALRQQPVDSLSAREWQRFQTLEAECSASRRQATHNSHGALSHGGHMMGVGIVATIMMAAMIVAMW